MKKIKKVIISFLILCILALCTFSATAWSIWHYGNQDNKKQADAAIVLGAAAWHLNPSPVFLERIRHGIWLYENDYIDYLIFTGGMGEGAEYSESLVAKKYAINAGIPAESIHIEESSRTTIEHFYYLTPILEEHNIATALIVSDPLHLKRAVRIANDIGLVAYSSPTPTTRYESVDTMLPFLFREVFYYIGYRIKNIF